MTTLKPITAVDLKPKLESGEAVLIDIREADEHARERVLGACLAPLSAIDSHEFDREHHKIAVFHCRSGMRTQANAAKLLSRGFREAYYLEGGLEAWKRAGLATHRNARAPLEIMRQVQIAAGALVLLGVILGSMAQPTFLGLSALVGAGLLFAGATGWCGMALLLRAMPWNRSDRSE